MYWGPNARRAVRRHVERALARLDPQRYHQEPAYVAALLARLDGVAYNGAEGRIEFRSTIVADRGPNSAESRFGADFAIVARLRSGSEAIEKAVMAQAKKGSILGLSQAERNDFEQQCRKMATATEAVLGLEVPVSASDTVLVREIGVQREARDVPLSDDSATTGVEIGRRPYELADYLCERLLPCDHGDHDPAFVGRAVPQRTGADGPVPRRRSANASWCCQGRPEFPN
jgi:hypothetical protein